MAGFQPVGPIASNRAPRQRGPRTAPPSSLRKLTLSIEAICSVSAGPTVFVSEGPVANVNHSELRDF